MSSAPDGAAGAASRAPRGDTAITVAALVLLWALTAAYVVDGAGLGMGAWDMTRAALWPKDHATSTMGAMVAWDARGAVLMAAMWWTMMIAMMVPGAAPAVLLYARVHRQAQARPGGFATAADAARVPTERAMPGVPPVGAFVVGYLVVWGVFAIVATALHGALEATGALAPGTMGLRQAWLAGAVLVATGLYQLSPWKQACLAECRSPAQFLTTHWRAGGRGALMLGARHGAFCLGCCWALMALLFVGGVMNLAWIAVLTLFVIAEKLLPGGRRVALATGLALIAWGVSMALG